MKKLVVALVALILACSTVLTSCGCKEETKYDGSNFLANGTTENPYQIVKEQITLDIFVPRGVSNPPFSEMVMFKELSKMTNIKFNFIEADQSSYDAVRSAVWGDKKNLPDLFLFGNSVAEQSLYKDLGAIVPLNDPNLKMPNGDKVGSLIDNYMPTYKALLDDNFGIETTQNAKEIATFDNGKMYSTLSVGDVPRDQTFKMFINKEWVKNLQEDSKYNSNIKMSDGSDIPDVEDIKTIEQYLDILHLFNDYDVNRNGVDNDEVAVSSKSLDYLRNFIMASYGYVTPGVELKNDGSEMTYVPETPEYKMYLQTANEMYKSGLMDRGTFSITTDAQLAQKGLEGRLGSFVSAAAYLTVGMDLESQYVTLAPLTSEHYTGDPVQWAFSYFEPTATLIPTGTPYLREIARLIDILYTEVGTQLMSYGKEGVHFEWDNAEKTSWTFKVPEGFEGTQEDYRATITPNVGTGSKVYWSYDFVGKMNDPIIKSLNEMSEIYRPYLKVPIPAEIKLTSDEYYTIETINASIDVFIKTKEYSFVTGELDFSKDYSKYLDDLKGYKSSTIVKIYNDAYQALK